MKKALRHIILAFTLSFISMVLYGQNMDQYELLCKQCLELKDRVAEGEKISRAEASALISAFLEMNKEIKGRLENLSADERKRFEMVNNWFSTGIRPLAMDHKVDLPAILATFGYEKISSEIVSAQEISADYPISKRYAMQTYLLASYSLPSAYGLLLGIQKGRWGGYLHLSSNFIYKESKYQCTSDGKLSSGKSFWGNGNSALSNTAGSIGALIKLSPWINVYTGAGYGESKLYWQDIDESWAIVKDYNIRGGVFECGALVSWNSICFGIGISTINFKTSAIDISIGLRF